MLDEDNLAARSHKTKGKNTMQDKQAPENQDALQLNRPPFSLEAEQSVLGGLMLDNNAFDLIADTVSPEDFYRADHRIIYSSIVDMVEQGQPFDVVTLAEHIDKEGKLEQAGGLAYLGELASNIPSVANIEAYAQIVRGRATRRQIITASHDIARISYTPEGRSDTEVLEEAERKIFQIAEARSKDKNSLSFRESLMATIDTIDTLYHSGSAITGLATGYTDLDKKTYGLQDSDLIVVAGRPSMGKTTLAMNFVEHALLNTDKNVVVFSLEMPAQSIIMRMLSSVGRIDQEKIRTGKLGDADWAKMTAAVSLLKEAKLHIEDNSSITPAVMRAKTRRIAREKGKIGLVVVDYLQLMHTKGGSENRTNEISEISRSLKALARELNCPVVALSQLNRTLEQRPNKRPINSDLRESGAIEQDADLILFVYRDVVYHAETEHPGVAEVIIGKQRNGPIGTVRLTFNGQHSRFDNLAPGDYDFDD